MREDDFEIFLNICGATWASISIFNNDMIVVSFAKVMTLNRTT